MDFRFALINIRTFEEIMIPEPIGFDGISIMAKRDEKMHGMTFDFVEQPLSFEGLGREMILSEYGLYGINAQIRFLVEYNCGNEWQTFYSGLLDFKTLEIETGDVCFAKLLVGEESVKKLVDDRLDIKIDVENLETLDGSEMEKYFNIGNEIEIPGKAIRLTNYAIVSNDIVELVYGGTTPGKIITGYYRIPFGDTIAREIEEFNNSPILIEISGGDFRWDVANSDGGIFINRMKHFISNTFDVSAKLTLETVNTNYKSYEIFIDLIDQNGRLIERFFHEFIDWNENKTIIWDFPKRSIIIDTDCYLAAWVDIGTIVGDNTISQLIIKAGSFIKIETKSIFQETPAKSFAVHETLSRIVESITDTELTVASDYYGRTDSEINKTIVDGASSLRCFTNGFLLRRAEFEDGSIPKFTVSLKDMIDGLNAIDAIGFGIEGEYFRVEPINYFYNDSIILKCENVNYITRNVNDTVCFGIVNIGYAKWEAEQWNGIDGFHGKRQYRTSIVRKNTLEQFCKFVADGYAIEATRRRQLTEPSKDWRYDNDTFIFDMFRHRNAMMVTKGKGADGTLIDPTSVMNVELSPARNAARWFHWIVQGSTETLGYDLIFTGAEGYAGAITETRMTDDATGASSGKNPIILDNVTENQNITAGDIAIEKLRYPKFKPMIAEFEYPFTIYDYKSVKNNPYGLIEVIQGNSIEYGWIKEIEYRIFDGIAKFQLILKK